VNGFRAAPPLPDSWAPGTPLALRGPLGHGFRLPAGVRRLALIEAWPRAEGDGPASPGVARLLPLADRALEGNAAVTLFAAGPLPDLPLPVEAYPLEAAPEAARWADFLAVEVPLDGLPGLREVLGLGAGEPLASAGQALVVSPMPCAGLADCGVCAVQTRRSWKLACVDGPVFDLKDLLD
jgi:dihydroorotate dehydrogenase electron transfer subunit